MKTILEFARSSAAKASHGALKDWLQKHRAHKDTAFVGSHAPELPETELKHLRKENKRLQRERDILKKATQSKKVDIFYLYRLLYTIPEKNQKSATLTDWHCHC